MKHFAVFLFFIVVLLYCYYTKKGGYVPTKAGSGGLDPHQGLQGEREAYPIHDSEIGWWNGEILRRFFSVSSIYDGHGIPDRTVCDIGWWGN